MVLITSWVLVPKKVEDALAWDLFQFIDDMPVGMAAEASSTTVQVLMSPGAPCQFGSECSKDWKGSRYTCCRKRR